MGGSGRRRRAAVHRASRARVPLRPTVRSGPIITAGAFGRFASSPYPERIVGWHGAVDRDAKWTVLVESDLFCFPSHTEATAVRRSRGDDLRTPGCRDPCGEPGDAVVEGEGGWSVTPNHPMSWAHDPRCPERTQAAAPLRRVYRAARAGLSLSGFGSESGAISRGPSVSRRTTACRPVACGRRRPMPLTCWATRSRRRIGTRSSPKWTP